MSEQIASVREGAYLLRKRADSYASDAEILRHHGNTDDAPTYDVIARELRAAAEVLEALARSSTALRGGCGTSRASGRMGGLETPAPADTGRGHGPTNQESNVPDRNRSHAAPVEVPRKSAGGR